MTGHKRPRRPPVHDSRPLTADEEHAVERQGDCLAWVREQNPPDGGPGLLTDGVRGGNPGGGNLCGGNPGGGDLRSGGPGSIR
ncbi:hypothetical protein [Nocardiopsis synnemataformans]|uniref:hypothetical protein n=1 Tax=Nocardiopsis synnemataformans TaxID=61305 RepID=UPI003EC00674